MASRVRGSLVHCEGAGQIGFGLLAGFGGDVSASAGKVTVAAFPEGPGGDVFLGELLDEPRGLELIEQVLHEDRFLHGRDGNACGELVGQLGLAQAAGRGGGLFQGVGPLQVGDLAFGGGGVGGEGFVAFAAAGELGGAADGVRGNRSSGSPASNWWEWPS